MTQRNGGVASFIMIGGPVCLALFGNAVFSLHFSCGFCVELNIMRMISVLEMTTEFSHAPGAWVVLLSVAKAHPRF